MSLNQIIDQKPGLPLVCDDTLKLKGYQLRLINSLDVPEGNFDNVNTFTINGNVYPPGGGFLPNPVSNKILRTNNLSVVSWGDVNPSNLTGGVVGDVLKTIAPNTVAWDPVKPADLTPGTALQILHTKSDGSAAEWTTNLEIPGTAKVDSTLLVLGSTTLDSTVLCNQTLTADSNLFVNDSIVVQNDLQVANGNLSVDIGTSTLASLNVVGNLQLNGSSGTSGQFVKKTGISSQDYSNIAASDITAGSDRTLLTSLGGVAQWLTPATFRNIKYGTTFSAQDLNAGVGPTAVSFSNTPFLSINVSNTSSVTGITQPSATQFMINDTGSYNVSITGYIDPTSLGIGNTVLTLSAEVGGTEQQVSCVVCNATAAFSGTIPGLTITAGQVLRILVRRVVGTRPMSTFSSASAIPSFASSIVISVN